MGSGDTVSKPRQSIAQPKRRRLRVFAFDPAASVQLETAVINDSLVDLPWEAPWESGLELGPTNDYLEVIDFDPSSGLFAESLMASVASNSEDAKTRLKDFLEKRGKKVLRG